MADRSPDADTPTRAGALPDRLGGRFGASDLARVRVWLFDQAFPFWVDRGVDREGPGFVEHLTLQGVPADVPFKRVRVQARQIYCFAQAHQLGWAGDALGAAERGVELLVGKAWAGRDGGWATALSRSGAVLDPTPDLYDIAFVLFALAWWFRVSGDPRVVPIAADTLDFLQAQMRHPSGEGYLHRMGGAAPYLQNPHMHLTEAMIALRDATGHDRFAGEADRLVDLCLGRFVHGPSGAVAETFDPGWQPMPGTSGLLFEPGHQYEWVWLLDQYLGTGSADRSDVRAGMVALFNFAVARGQGGTGLVLESVLADGTVAGSDHRLWPQVERLKAWIAMASRHGIDAAAAVAGGLDQVFEHYLTTEPAGTWIEYRDRDLKPKVDKIPASSFYHLVLAFAETLRFYERPAGAANHDRPVPE